MTHSAQQPPTTSAAATLSADRPSTDPASDLFGHAPFARTLARAIQGYRSSDGIVLALYGPWGSGKSTVLAYVEHELSQVTPNDRPVVVSFNPWWFSGHEHLAKAYLAQLQVVLPSKYKGFKAAGDLLGRYSSAIGTALDVVKPGVGKFVAAGLKIFSGKPQDVPELKKKLTDLLLREKKRVLVIIDDIDRLAPDEIRQLFTVIKALADFPYVTYLLAFDREVASQAIGQQTGLPGERFLEKIIQVPFELPRADRATLQRALFTRLESIMAPSPLGRFDPGYWSNIFHSGLDALFTVPRDVVRLTNALSVTYPAVVGEVNPVDFIAIECLRVFRPSVYDVIRTSPSEFWDYRAPTRDAEKERAMSFHDGWLSQIPEHERRTTKKLMRRLFPRLDSVWSNTEYGSDSLFAWRRELRICVPDIFPAYFRLALPRGAISRADVDGLLAVALNASEFAAALRDIGAQVDHTGASKAGPLLDRLMDHVPDDLNEQHAEPVITALHSVGDELLFDAMPRTAFDFGSESRVRRVVYHLLKQVPSASRQPLLAKTLSSGDALRCFQYLLVELARETREKEARALLSDQEVAELKAKWCATVAARATQPKFIDRPQLGEILHAWLHWGEDGGAIAWWKMAQDQDEGLLKLIKSFSTIATSQTFGDHAARAQLRVNPRTLALFANVEELAGRIQHLLDAGKIHEPFLPSATQFVREVRLMQAGKDPDSIDFLAD